MKTASTPIISNGTIEAVIVEMDGVITQTALLHARAWKMMFDSFLKSRENSQPVPSLDIQKDYLLYIDGKPRLDGVRSFLASRNIHLPEGTPRDAPGTETLHGLGNLKNQVFLSIIEGEGVDVFGDAVACIKQWRAEGKKIAVISSSKNCAFILKKAGLDHLFDVRIDGLTMAQLKAGLGYNNH